MDTVTYTGASYASKVTCDRCGATVPAHLRELHTSWHAELQHLTTEQWPTN